MSISVALVHKLDTVAPQLRDVLLELVDEIEQHREASVTKVEFNELKEIVRDLAQAQVRTEQRMEELAQAQARTEAEVAKLAVSQTNLRSQVGGLAQTMAYALENIVGESVSQLDDASKLGQLHRKLAAAQAVESLPLVPLLVTHFAHPKLLAQAEREGIIVVQSFEW